jgi:hypothetical protein
MATNLRRIEKEFILGSARDDRIPLLIIAGSGEWPCLITDIAREGLSFTHSMPLNLLKRGQEYEFRFVYREQPMAFRARISELMEASFVCEMPESVYKNLVRHYSRRVLPSDLTLSLALKGERYELSFPIMREFEPVDAPEPNSAFDPQDIRSLVGQFNERAAKYAAEHSLRMFKDKGPDSREERLIVRTGKIYYLPNAAAGLPSVDPYVPSRIVTRDIFADFLRGENIRENLIGDEVLRFERDKKSSGILSELMIPLLFQEYVIGYVYLANAQQGKSPIDLSALETFHQFAKVFAYSLKINGYFRNAPKKARDIAANILDISAGGLLFSTSARNLSTSLLPGSELELSIKVKGRAIKASASIKRIYRDATRSYFGLEFTDLAPEDFRFLFECLYGRGFTDEDAAGIEGLGPKASTKKQ